MTFQVITDPDKLRELGKAGLLWYTLDGCWYPSANRVDKWESMRLRALREHARRGDYAILLEE